MKVSLILASVGRSDEVGRCLQSLAVQTDPCFEVIVVDQNQDDRLCPHVRDALKAGVNVVHLRMNKPSLSGARNLGISNATGEIIGFTDDDCWYEGDAIAALRHVFLGEIQLDGVVGQWVEQAQRRPGGQTQGYLTWDAWKRFRGGDASSISLFFRKQLIEAVGSFDERFGVGQWFGAGEETDFVLRALQNDAKLLNVPSVRIHHHYPDKAPPVTKVTCKNYRRRARGTGAIYAKHKLSAIVVARGFIAPVAKPILHADIAGACLGVFISLGRIEGYLRWKAGRNE